MGLYSEHKDEEINELLEDIKKLKLKLSETESRIAAQILDAVKKVLSESEYIKLLDCLSLNVSLDALEIERQIATRAKSTSDSLENVFNAAKKYKMAQEDYNEVSNADLTETEKIAKCQELYDAMIRAREKLFSTIKEYEIRQNVETVY